jgi:hypothetical protein
MKSRVFQRVTPSSKSQAQPMFPGGRPPTVELNFATGSRQFGLYRDSAEKYFP